MMKFSATVSVILGICASIKAAKTRPNIVFIFTDDQDLRHGSLETQRAVQSHLAAKGTTFTNHYSTVAVCCPSRVSLMRGQAAHNTNNTAISAPGGGYPKFVASAENENYLPHWLSKADYNAEYIGKLFNGNSLLNYSPGPLGWRHIDVLLEPYINTHNTVVMSENGARPKHYSGFQQTDVIRIKAIERLRLLIDEENPFFLMISPTAPHVQNLYDPPAPPARYYGLFNDTTVPRTPNFNPPQKYQKGKPSWLRNLAPLNSTQIDEIDLLYQRRLESLRGVDDIVDDVVEMLEKRGIIDNTYTINVEYWGSAYTEIPTWSSGDYGVYFPGVFLDNDYKTMRVVGEKSSWMYSRWCTNGTELYNTADDPYELKNLSNLTDPHTRRVKSRLNALLMVTKSCTKSTCRDPWSIIQPPSPRHGKKVETLHDSLDPHYDAFYDAFPLVTIDECMNYQFAANEGPFFPPSAQFELGLEYRNSTDNFAYAMADPMETIAENSPLAGGWEQRQATYETLVKAARVLTDREINNPS